MRQPQTPQMPALWFADFSRAEPKESEPGFVVGWCAKRGTNLELHLEPVLGL